MSFTSTAIAQGLSIFLWPVDLESVGEQAGKNGILVRDLRMCSIVQLTHENLLAYLQVLSHLDGLFRGRPKKHI